MWHVVGPIGTVWEDAQVTIASNYVYQIIFEGVRASSPEGTIAIDNITLSFEACKKKGKQERWWGRLKMDLRLLILIPTYTYIPLKFPINGFPHRHQQQKQNT